MRRGDGTYVISTVYMENDVLGFGQIKDRYQLALDLFDVRLMIEPEIVTWACRKATKEQIAKLRELCNEVERLYKQGYNHIQKDIEFHTAIAMGSKNLIIPRLIPIINSSIPLFVETTGNVLKVETIETHREIATAIAQHNAIKAQDAMTMHLMYNRRCINSKQNL